MVWGCFSEAALFAMRQQEDEASFIQSPHYVSRVFRQETGTNFGEYLTQYRIDMAKKWLKESDMKIVEIANGCSTTTPPTLYAPFAKRKA
jgi:YesN/AraC family two-component response regulator